ncbi:hypothetical protein LB452_08520 [Psychroflexus sp. CAK8W]|uniref:PH domain-containing protein n=1 Tax=Psychroflexus longus TaxID=2873596 RepID=A0ABS7XJ14_9FLAO|nr:hypothetical protein [Psychroflexus longus]MBZ9778965.1 hypothetical protein [Psychroflexus longus]
MKIKFSNYRLYINLGLGITWIIMGTYSLNESDSSIWKGIVYMILAVLYLGHYLYDLKHGYLEIENGIITKNILYGFKNKMELDDIQQIEKVKGNYILKSASKTMKIKIDLIDHSSLNKLLELLKGLDLPSEKSFLASWK